MALRLGRMAEVGTSPINSVRAGRSSPRTFSGWARGAGLPDGYTAHGLRKNMGSLFAELGMNQGVISATFGHTTAEEARGYIVEVNNERLAARGLAAFTEKVAWLWRRANFPTFGPAGKVRELAKENQILRIDMVVLAVQSEPVSAQNPC